MVICPMKPAMTNTIRRDFRRYGSPTSEYRGVFKVSIQSMMVEVQASHTPVHEMRGRVSTPVPTRSWLPMGRALPALHFLG